MSLPPSLITLAWALAEGRFAPAGMLAQCVQERTLCSTVFKYLQWGDEA